MARDKKPQIKDGELSLDDLDKVVGGGAPTSERPREDIFASPVATSEHVVVPPPPVESPPPNVESHNVEGRGGGFQPPVADAAVAQLAIHLASGDPGALENAGHEIFSLIQHRQARVGDAMLAVHDAVTTHALSGEQGVALLAEVMIAQNNTSGSNPTIGDAARNEIAALVSGHHVTVDHAITSIAVAAANEGGGGQYAATLGILGLCNQFQTPASQAVADIHAAVSHGITGDQAVSLLSSVAGSAYDIKMTAAAGAEIAALVADPAAHVTVDSAIGDIHAVIASGVLYGPQGVSLLAAVADHGDALLAAAGGEIAALIAGNRLTASQAMSGIDGAVTANPGVISGEHALKLVMGLANQDLTSAVVGEVTNLIATGHVTSAQAMGELAGAIANHTFDAAQVVSALAGLAIGGSSSQVQSTAGGELAALVAQGAVTATDVVNHIHNAGLQPRYEIVALLNISGSANEALQNAIGAEIASLISSDQISPYIAANVFGSLLGGSLDAAIGAQLANLIDSNAISADMVVGVLTSRASNAFAINQYSGPTGINTVQLTAICNTIASLVEHGQISARQAMADVSPSPYPYQAAQLLVQLSAHANPDVQAAATAQLVSMCTTPFRFGGTMTVLPTSMATAAFGSLLSAHTLTADQVVVAAAHLSSNSYFANSAGSQIASLIAQGQMTAAQAMSAIHNAVTADHSIAADTARSFLASIAAGDTNLQTVVNAELASLTRWATGAAASLGDQIIEGVTLGRTPAAAAMTEIENAVTGGRLTVAQALSVLGSLAVQGGQAVQAAAGAEFTALMGRNPTTDTVRDAFAASNMTGAQIVTLLLTSSLQDNTGPNYGLSLLYAFSESAVVTGPQIADSVNGMLAAHQFSGQQALGLWGQFASGSELQSFATTQIMSLIGNQSASIADVHTLVTQYRLPADMAVVGLAALLGQGNATLQESALNEIAALIGQGMMTPRGGATLMTADQLVPIIHDAVMSAGQSAASLTPDQGVIALMAFAKSGDAALRDAAANELSTILSLGRVTAAQFAADIGTLIGPHITGDQALAMLVHASSGAQPEGQTAITSGIVTLITGGQVPLDHAMTSAAALPNAAAALQQIGSALVDMVANQQATPAHVTMVGELVAAHSISLEQALTTLANAAAQRDPAMQAAAGLELATMVAAGQVAAAQAVAAIHSAVESRALTPDAATALLLGMAPVANAALLSAVGAELGALVAQGQYNAAAVIAAVHDGLLSASHTLSAEQATALLCSFVFAGDAELKSAAMKEFNGLIASGQLPAAAVFTGIASAAASGVLTGDQAALMSIGIAGTNPALLPQVTAAIANMIAQGWVSADAVMADIQTALASGAIAPDRAVMLLADMADSGLDGMSENVRNAIGALIASGAISATAAMADIGDAVKSGALGADAAVGLLTRMSAFGSGELKSEAAKEIGALIAAGDISRAQALSNIVAILPGRSNYHFGLLAGVAVPAGLTAELGALVGLRISADPMHALENAKQATAFIQSALGMQSITNVQAVALIASIGGNVTATSVGYDVNPWLHERIQSLCRFQMNPAEAVEAMHALAARGDVGMKTFAGGEIDALLKDPKVLIDTGGRGIALTAGEVGARLSEMIKFGQADGSGIISLIASEVAAQAFSPQQGLLMTVMAARDTNFFLGGGQDSGGARVAAVGNAIATLMQAGLTADTLVRDVTDAVNSHLVGASSAVTMLAGAAMHGELRGAAASGIAALIGTGPNQISGADAADSVLRYAAGRSGGINPDQAVATLAQVAAASGANDAIAARLVTYGISASQVAADVSALVGAPGGLTPAQALNFFASLAEHGSTDLQGVAGQALVTMVANHQISMADIRGAIASNAVPPDAAVVMLAGMTARGNVEAQNGALAEIASLIGSGRISTAQVVAEISGVYNQSRSSYGLTGDQAAAVLATIGTPEAISAIAYVCIGTQPGQVSAGGAFAAMIDVAAHLPVEQQSTVLKAMLYTSLNVQRPDIGAIVGAAVASHSLTAEQAVSVLAGAIGVPGIASNDASCTAAIAALVAQGQIAATQTMAAIHGVIAAHGMPVNDEVFTLFGGLLNGTPAMQSAVGAEIAALVAGHQVSAPDAMGMLHEAVRRGALNVDNAIVMLAAAVGAAPSLQDTVANEMAKLVHDPNGWTQRITPAEIITDIRGLLASHVLNAEQAFSLCASMAVACAQLPMFGNLMGDSARGAFADGIAAAVSANQVSAGDALAALLGLASHGTPAQQALAGGAIGAMLVQNQVPADQVIASLQATSGSVDQEIAALANAAARGGAALQSAVNGELVRLVSAGQVTAEHAVAVLTAAAAQGPAGQTGNAMQHVVGGEIAALIAANPSLRTQLVTAASVALNDVNAVTVLIGIAAAGDPATQVAVGNEIGRKLTGSFNTVTLMAGIGEAVGGHLLTADQAVEVLAGVSAANGTTFAIQTLASAQLAALMANNQIAADKVMADIHSAVTAGSVGADQALALLAHISEGANAAVRQAAITEAAALLAVRPVVLTGEQAVTVLALAAGSGSVALQNIVGALLGGMIDAGQLTSTQVVDGLSSIISNQAGSQLAGDQAVAVLIGLGVNGSAAVQIAAGEAIVGLVGNHRTTLTSALHDLDAAVTANAITVAQALRVLVNISGALDPDRLAAQWGGAEHRIDGFRAAIGDEARLLVNRGQITFNAAVDTILDVGAANPRSLLGVGSALGALMDPDPGSVFRTAANAAQVAYLTMSAIENSVSAHKLTMDQALIAFAGMAAAGHSAEVGTEIASLISRNAVTADHVVEVLTTAAASGNQTLQLAVGAEIAGLISAHQITAAQAAADIGAAIASHAITADQGVTVLAALAGAGDTSVQVAVGQQLSALVANNQITAAQAVADIRTAIAGHTLTANEAVLLLGGAIAAGTPDMRTAATGEIAVQIAFQNITAAQATALIGDAVASQAMNAAQALFTLSNLASASAPGYGIGSLQPAVNGQICALVATGRIGAHDAIAALATIAHEGTAAMQIIVGGEVAALIADNRITAAQATADIHAAVTGHRMTADHAVVMLAGMASNGTTATRDAVVAEIAALVAQGQITAAQAMADIANAATPERQGVAANDGPKLLTPTQAMELLAANVYGTMAIRDAALDSLADMIGRGQIDAGRLVALLDRSAQPHTFAYGVEFQLIAQLGAHGDASLQSYVHDRLKSMMSTGLDGSAAAAALNAVQLLTSLAGAGSDDVQKFAGSEIARLSAENSLLTSRMVHDGIRAMLSEGRISSPQLLMLGIGLNASATSADMHNTGMYWISAAASSDPVRAFDAIGNGLPHDQAIVLMAQLSGSLSLQTAAANEIVDMIASGKVTAAQAVADLHSAVGHGLSDDGVIKMLTGIALAGKDLPQADVNAVITAIATETLTDWGVSATASNYNALMNGMIEATQGFLSLQRGQTTLPSLLATLDQHAADANIPVDAVYAVLLRECRDWNNTTPAGRAATDAIGREILDHLMETKHGDIADLVVAGGLDRNAAANLINHISDIVAPTVMPFQGSMIGMTSAQIDAYYDQRGLIIATAARNVMDVEIHVAADASLILSGRMTAQEAIADLQRASNVTGFALDMGLSRLAELTAHPTMPADLLNPEMSGATPADVAAGRAALDAANAAHTGIMQALACRIESGQTADALVQAYHNRMIGQGDVIEIMLKESGIGRSGDELTLVQNIALTTLLEKSAANIDMQHTVNGNPAYSGLTLQLLNNAEYLQKMLSGVSSLTLLDPEHMGDHLTWSKNLFSAYVHKTADPQNLDSVTEKAAEARQWYEDAWKLISLQATMGAFGNLVALTRDANDGDASVTQAFDGWVRFGAVAATQGLPLVNSVVGAKLGINPIQDAVLNAAWTGAASGPGAAVTSVEVIPEWVITRMTSFAPQGGVEMSVTPALAFTAINLTAKLLPLLFTINAVAEGSALATGTVRGVCGMVSAACDVISNSITESVVGAATTAGHAALDAIASFDDIYQVLDGVSNGRPVDALVQNLENHARDMGENVFKLMFAGTDVNAVAAAGVDTGQFLVDAFSGNTSALEESAQKMGLSLARTITSNVYLHIVGDQLENFGQKLYDTAWEMQRTIGDSSEARWFARNIMGMGV